MIELPQMTHPLSRHWHQPSADEMAVYDDIAIMDRSTLERLANYSLTNPTGAYEGKMWRRCSSSYMSMGLLVSPVPVADTQWLLCWYGPSEDPDMVSINSRPIRLIRDEDEQETTT